MSYSISTLMIRNLKRRLRWKRSQAPGARPSTNVSPCVSRSSTGTVRRARSRTKTGLLPWC